jgi:hypothetical protein
MFRSRVEASSSPTSLRLQARRYLRGGTPRRCSRHIQHDPDLLLRRILLLASERHLHLFAISSLAILPLARWMGLLKNGRNVWTKGPEGSVAVPAGELGATDRNQRVLLRK